MLTSGTFTFGNKVQVNIDSYNWKKSRRNMFLKNDKSLHKYIYPSWFPVEGWNIKAAGYRTGPHTCRLYFYHFIQVNGVQVNGVESRSFL